MGLRRLTAPYLLVSRVLQENSTQFIRDGNAYREGVQNRLQLGRVEPFSFFTFPESLFDKPLLRFAFLRRQLPGKLKMAFQLLHPVFKFDGMSFPISLDHRQSPTNQNSP